MSKRLTALAVENAKPGTSRREISDGGSGLYLIVQPSGHKSWAVRYRVNGDPKKLTLPAGLTLAEAREQAANAIKQVERGNDPVQAKKVAKHARLLEAANTFEAVAELYLASDKVKKLRTADQLRYRLDRVIFPLIGATPIADIKRSQITAALDHVEKHNGPVAADRALSIISCVLHYHAKRSDDYVVPLVRGMNKTSNADRARKRILTDAEIRAIWNYGNAYLRLLLLTGARRDEVAAMRWREIEGNIWTLPASRHKTKTEVIRPLSKLAMSILPERGADNEFIFRPGSDLPFHSFDLLKRRVIEATGIASDWRFHDLRRTARSLLSRAGINGDVAEMILGHTLKGVRGIYDRHSYLEEKAHALEALAHQITLIINPPKGNVHPIKRKRAS